MNFNFNFDFKKMTSSSNVSNFEISSSEIKLTNLNFYKNLNAEQSSLLFTITIILFTTIITVLIERFCIKRPKIFQIYYDQLASGKFLPFNYLIIMHLDKSAFKCSLSDLETTKLKFELITSKQKRTVNFSLPAKYLINYQFLFFIQLYNRLYYFFKFFSFSFLTSTQNNEIWLLVHRKSVLEHIASVRIHADKKIDLVVYLHGLTIYSFNANFAYYCSIEELIKCNVRSLNDPNITKSNESAKDGKKSYNFIKDITCKDVRLLCKHNLIDLAFSPNYYQKLHPYYGCPIEFIYCKLAEKAVKGLPRMLRENLAPVNRQTSLKLELLYYVELGDQIKSDAKKPPSTNTDSINNKIKGILTGNLMKFDDTLAFHLFNLNLLFFTLVFGLNSTIQNQRPTPFNLLPIIFVASIFSLLFTEFISNLYYCLIRRNDRFLHVQLILDADFKQECINCLFFTCLNLAIISLIAWSSTLSILLKQHQKLNIPNYKIGFALHFLDSDDYLSNDFRSSKEIAFLLTIFYASVLVMFRFWILILNSIRLVFVLAFRFDFKNCTFAKSNAFKSNEANSHPLASRISFENLKDNNLKVKSRKLTKTPSRTLSKEMEHNLFRYFTKK